MFAFKAFCLITYSLPFSSVSERLAWMQAATPSSSSWHLMIVWDDDHQDHEIWGKVMTPLQEINTAVQKTLHWFAPDLKGKSANIERDPSVAGLVTEHQALTKQEKGQQTSCIHCKVISYCTKIVLRHCSQRKEREIKYSPEYRRKLFLSLWLG